MNHRVDKSVERRRRPKRAATSTLAAAWFRTEIDLFALHSHAHHASTVVTIDGDFDGTTMRASEVWHAIFQLVVCFHHVGTRRKLHVLGGRIDLNIEVARRPSSAPRMTLVDFRIRHRLSKS